MTPEPPVPRLEPVEIVSAHGTRIDEYAWMRDDARSNPEVLAHLRAENEYRDAMVAGLKPLEDTVNAEIVGRIKQDDSSVPYVQRGYRYWRRYVDGAEYPLLLRSALDGSAREETLLDLNAQALGHDFYDVGEFEVSPDNHLLAYAEDTVGRRQY